MFEKRPLGFMVVLDTRIFHLIQYLAHLYATYYNTNYVSNGILLEDFKSKKQIFRVALAFPLILFIAYFSVFASGQLDNDTDTVKYMLEI